MSLSYVLLLLLSTTTGSRDRPTLSAARKFLSISSPNGLLRSIPAFSKRNNDYPNPHAISEVGAFKIHKPKKLEFDPKPLRNSGTYYGFRVDKVSSYTAPTPGGKKRNLDVKETMVLTLDELRAMRHEMEALRKELEDMKRQFRREETEGTEEFGGVSSLLSKAKRRKEFNRIGNDVERWAEKILEEGEEDGWREVECNKVLRTSINPYGRTKAYLKWMRDSRGSHANQRDEREYPCIKVYSTIDAPLDEVCVYLSQEKHVPEYNDIVVKHRDLEEIEPHSKICWGQTPKILFIKPRDLVTYCHLRWLRDGTQVLVNQACEHKEASAKRQNPRAFALRGANFIGRDPDDPEKTRIIIISHANPGEDVPTWAMKTAVNTLAPIEPFKLFNRINDGVSRAKPELERRLEEIEMVSIPGKCPKPAGIAQMGYACFWPEGGGLQESAFPKQTDAEQPDDNPTGLYNDSE